jgi:hypothetical protein
MKELINKLGVPVTLDLAGYIFTFLVFNDSRWIDPNLSIILSTIDDIIFIIAGALSIKFIYLSQRKTINRDNAIKLFQQGIWGILLLLPMLIYISLSIVFFTKILHRSI